MVGYWIVMWDDGEEPFIFTSKDKLMQYLHSIDGITIANVMFSENIIQFFDKINGEEGIAWEIQKYHIDPFDEDTP